jgi:hypothetical protein
MYVKSFRVLIVQAALIFAKAFKTSVWAMVGVFTVWR